MLLVLPFPPGAVAPGRTTSCDAHPLCLVVGGKAWPGLRKGRRLAPGAAAGPGRASSCVARPLGPVGGGKAWPGFEIDHSERSSRVAISRAGRRPRDGKKAGGQATPRPEVEQE